MSSSRFANANNNGNPNYNDASNRNANSGIRPLLIISYKAIRRGEQQGMRRYPSESVKSCRDALAYGRQGYPRGIRKAGDSIYVDFAAHADALLASAKRMEKTSGWKYSTQKMLMNILPTIYEAEDALRAGTYQSENGTTFTLCERGHRRVVQAPSARDMLIQHTIVDAVLVPVLRRYLIHDNGASLKGKGISFTRRRFEEHLRWHYRRHGTDGYVLKIDFRKYFDNIDHKRLLAAFAERIPDARLLQVIEHILTHNRVDVSWSGKTAKEWVSIPYSSLDAASVPEKQKTGRVLLDRSLGIGSPLSQIAGIFFPTRIDNYVKTVLGVHCYDAYMDDRIVIHPSKDFLVDLLGGIDEQARVLGLFLHPKKTQISKLSRGVRFLNTRYKLTETGRIVRGIPRDVVVRERRKLKHLARLVEQGKLTRAAFVQQYKSWRGDKKRYDAHGILVRMDDLYHELLGGMEHGRRTGNDGSSPEEGAAHH